MENAIIGLRAARCKDCYKCIRNCKVKAISCLGEQARILDENCIYCGKCLLVCPQNAKIVNSDLPKVKKALAVGEKLAVSLAPSYIAAFPGMSLPKMAAALSALGFSHIEETAIGASMVTQEYEKLMRARKMPNIITSSCVSVNLLIQKYYPALLGQLAPVVTPGAAHARMLRQIYGPRTKVVFIGPCIAKKQECAADKAYYAVLTFDELAGWLHEQDEPAVHEEGGSCGVKNPLSRYYPATGGIIHTLSKEVRRLYECVSVDGVDRCISVLETIECEGLTGYFIEMNACPGGCLGGPGLHKPGNAFLSSKDLLLKNARRTGAASPALTDGVRVPMARRFRDLSSSGQQFSEEEIRRVLLSTGKATPEQELNCGCCGYETCREKAVAVLRGKADIKMCVPYMRQLAESHSNTVVENAPIGVVILDQSLRVTELNPAAAALFHLSRDASGMQAEELLPVAPIAAAWREGHPVVGEKAQYEKLGLIVEQTIVPVPGSGQIFLLLKDITREEKLRESRNSVTQETIRVAREVVAKQMVVVQEIAGLLGDTTADTQAALTQLTHSIESQNHDEDA